MKPILAALTLAAAVLPSVTLPAAAARIGEGGKQATLEAAPTAKGERSFFKALEMECGGSSCLGTLKGKAGRKTTITEVQCSAGSDGQVQGGQVNVEEVFVELLPIASRSTDGVSEIAIIKTPTSFVLSDGQKATIGLFFFGNAEFASCLAKGTSTPS